MVKDAHRFIQRMFVAIGDKIPPRCRAQRQTDCREKKVSALMRDVLENHSMLIYFIFNREHSKEYKCVLIFCIIIITVIIYYSQFSLLLLLLLNLINIPLRRFSFLMSNHFSINTSYFIQNILIHVASLPHTINYDKLCTFGTTIGGRWSTWPNLKALARAHDQPNELTNWQWRRCDGHRAENRKRSAYTHRRFALESSSSRCRKKNTILYIVPPLLRFPSSSAHRPD